MHYITM